MSDIDRRNFVHGIAAATTLTALGCGTSTEATPVAKTSTPAPPKTVDPVLGTETLTRSPWPTDDPFLFCAYHLDAYPKGNEQMGPAASLMGRRMGKDFSGRSGWSMYHGQVIPGFPRHPHRGFETVTVTRRGLVDHSDSLGATARYGDGDAQWMTAGSGIVHAEMFPLRSREADNPLELFQVWLNLPGASKMVPPHFSMLWGEGIPEHRLTDAAGKLTVVRTIAGALNGQVPPAPPPHSWASRPEAHVAIWTVKMAPNARWELPAAAKGLSRSVYLHRGAATVSKRALSGTQRIRLRSAFAAPIQAGPEGAELLLLEGRPIGEPVAKHGPFVMNTRDELVQAYNDYKATKFGGWPWGDDAPAHEREAGRFAIHADGRKDVPV